MKLWRRIVALIMVTVVAAAALVPSVAAASTSSITTDVLSSLAASFGVSGLQGVYCVNCGTKVDLSGLESGLLSAVCPSCGKTVFLESNGSVSTGGFFGTGGSSRGGGAGRDYVPEPVISSSGSVTVPIFFTLQEDSIDGVSFLDNFLIFNYKLSKVSYLWWYRASSGFYKRGINGNFVPPVSGTYQIVVNFSVWSDYPFRYSSTIHTSVDLLCDSEFSWNDVYSVSGVRNVGKSFYIDNPKNPDAPTSIYCAYDSIKDILYPVYGFVYGFATLTDVYTPETIDSPYINQETNQINIGNVSVGYDTIYKYGDTYITYNNNVSNVYYVDQSGAILGNCYYDQSNNVFQITDYVANPPATPEPTATPEPSAAPQPSATPDPDGGGSGGDGGSDSGGGIWDMVAQGISDLLGVIGKLIGGILSGFLNLLTELVGSVTAALPLIDEVAAIISGLYSFLPESWQVLLTAAFSLMLTFAVVKLVLGVLGK